MVEEREEVIRFCQESSHKRTIDHLTQVLGKVRKVEKYHKERFYVPRIKED